MDDHYMGHEPHIGQKNSEAQRSSHEEDLPSARHPEVRAKRASKGDGPDRAAGCTDELGSPDDARKQEGKREAFEAAAIKEVLARQLAAAMKAQSQAFFAFISYVVRHKVNFQSDIFVVENTLCFAVFLGRKRFQG